MRIFKTYFRSNQMALSDRGKRKRKTDCELFSEGFDETILQGVDSNLQRDGSLELGARLRPLKIRLRHRRHVHACICMHSMANVKWRSDF